MEIMSKLLLLPYLFSFECIRECTVHRFVAFKWDEIFFCSFKNTYHTHTYTCMCPKTINEHSSTLKNTYKSDENKKKKREKERKKNLYVYTYIGHTTGKTTFMSIQYETNVRKQCVFCNRTFHPKRINGEPLIKLCSICAQISAFSNTRSHIDWIIDKLLAQTITRMLGKSTTENCSPYHQQHASLETACG